MKLTLSKFPLGMIRVGGLLLAQRKRRERHATNLDGWNDFMRAGSRWRRESGNILLKFARYNCLIGIKPLSCLAPLWKSNRAGRLCGPIWKHCETRIPFSLTQYL